VLKLKLPALAPIPLVLFGMATILDTSPVLAAGASFPDPAVDTARSAAKGTERAVFAGGCFWCTEAVFEELAGVRRVVSGYTGGTPQTATYDLVSSGRTDHAEAIEITYDPARISYGRLLKVFFSVAHDPTQLNRQGPDVGRQYRSAVFYTDPEQKRVVEAYIQQLTEAKVFGKPIVTEVQPLHRFHAAEAYHQDFVQRNPRNGYVVVNAVPKLQKLRQTYPELLKR
jgi:peptide-methionine (S)-S-oxide reductase